MLDDQTKYKILSLLLQGETPTEVANRAEIGVTYATVLRYKRELDAAKLNGTIDQLLNVDRMLLTELAETIKADAPAELQALVEASTTKLNNGVSALGTLNLEFIATASALNTRIRALVHTTENMSELGCLVDALCKMQTAFFNKPITQVNVQNNVGGQAYSEYLTDVPAA